MNLFGGRWVAYLDVFQNSVKAFFRLSGFETLHGKTDVLFLLFSQAFGYVVFEMVLGSIWKVAECCCFGEKYPGRNRRFCMCFVMQGKPSSLVRFEFEKSKIVSWENLLL